MRLYVARDEDDALFLYQAADLYKTSTYWRPISCCFAARLDDNLFPEIRWKDSEPTEVELVIKK